MHRYITGLSIMLLCVGHALVDLTVGMSIYKYTQRRTVCVCVCVCVDGDCLQTVNSSAPFVGGAAQAYTSLCRLATQTLYHYQHYHNTTSQRSLLDNVSYVECGMLSHRHIQARLSFTLRSLCGEFTQQLWQLRNSSVVAHTHTQCIVR